MKCDHVWEMNPMCGEWECVRCSALGGPIPDQETSIKNAVAVLTGTKPPTPKPRGLSMIKARTGGCQEAALADAQHAFDDDGQG